MTENIVENKIEYKNTLNLPQTTLAMRANAAQKEPVIQEFWNENKIYEKISSKEIKQIVLFCTDGLLT